MSEKCFHEIFVYSKQFSLIAEQESHALICQTKSPLNVGEPVRVSEVNKSDGDPTGEFVLRIATLVTAAKKPTYSTGHRHRYIVRLEKLS